MSQGIFINTVNTYIGTALYEEFLGETPENSDWAIFSTYFEKEDSAKPAFIKKMLKPKSKPGLFRKYMLEKFDVMVYDMHSGRLEDLKQSIKALTKAPLEKEKIIIMISSILSWGKTEHKIVEDKPKKEGDDNQNNNDNNNDDDNDMEGMEGMEPMDGMENNNNKDDDPNDDNLTPEEKELKKIMAKIDLNEDYFNNSHNLDEDGNLIELFDEEGNLLEKEDEDYKPKLKQIKINKRVEKLKNVKKEIKVSTKAFLKYKFNCIYIHVIIPCN